MKSLVPETTIADGWLFATQLPMPISANKAYVNIGKGRRKLSPEGKVFKRVIIDAITPTIAVSKAEIFSGIPLELQIDLYFKALENKGWPKTCKSRYKRIDVSNRVKLLEDAIFEAFGLDDKLVFSLKVTKLPTKNGEDSFCNFCVGPYIAKRGEDE